MRLQWQIGLSLLGVSTASLQFYASSSPPEYARVFPFALQVLYVEGWSLGYTSQEEICLLKMCVL